MDKLVTVYTKPNCPQCMMTKKVMDQVGVKYETIDVMADDKAREMLMTLGYRRLPVVNAGDDNWWMGFQPSKIKALAGK